MALPMLTNIKLLVSPVIPRGLRTHDGTGHCSAVRRPDLEGKLP